MEDRYTLCMGAEEGNKAKPKIKRFHNIISQFLQMESTIRKYVHELS